MILPSKTSFIRDRFTWLAYFMAAYFSYLQAALGPLMPFLRDELGISYTVGGLHFSAFALGMILAGLISARMTQKWGRNFTFWGGAIGLSAGALCLALSHQVALTITSALLMGLLGSIVSITIQAALCDHHREHRAVALTEVNVAASVSASLVPLFIGGFHRIGLGWRSALFLGAIALILIGIRYRRVSIPTLERYHAEVTASSQTLPITFWIYWVVMFLGVSIEYCIFFWGADFLETAVGLVKSDAASAMSVFVLSGFAGRIVCSRLSRTIPSATLLASAIGITFLGFPILWLASFAPRNILGLLIAGLGVANFYPLILSLALGTAEAQSDIATARLSVGTGMAIFLAPFILGWIADQFALKQAFGLVILMLAAVAAISLFANHLVQESTRS
ncbi:hypothetical protein NIES2130_01715 [Scytonema sp. HK-05]|uniref:MFS transporter n=1 Tax=Scytonema sp. HK-05 TaxID=1137095 RepID=UPI000937696B|nr:MFS transporter [Scytonema sp. HK-05]OKH60825.1 hypothetical protein NIES2130_01715 [Scytonema sp. HK-05]